MDVIPDSGVHVAESVTPFESFRVLICTVKGDMHDIGKNMVATMLRRVGFELRDLGINVVSEEFVRHVEEYQPVHVSLRFGAFSSPGV
jgi:methanogenic corrinoid protein MtbC1